MKIRKYNRNTHIFRIALVVMSAITFAGVADAQEKTGKIQQEFTYKNNVRLWTENGNVIPVCWEPPGYNAEKAIVRSALSNTWERYANINFTGWYACPTGGISGSASEKQVRIRISPQGKENAGAARLG